MHHFIASLAILFFKTYSAHGLVTFWKILVRARRYSTMSSSRVKCTTLSIYSGSTIEDIIVSSSDEWENDSDDSEKESSGINQLTDDW